MSKTATSLQTFRAHIKRRADGTLDVSGVVSRECYLDWLDTKLAKESDEEAKKFHRTLTNHVSGVDGRSPFDPEEEAAILVMFRKRQPWPCFPPHMSSVGRRYRTKGFHEKQLLLNEKQPPVTANTAKAASSSAIISACVPPQTNFSLIAPSSTQRASPAVSSSKPLPPLLKLGGGSTQLSASLLTTAAQQLQRPIPPDNLEELLSGLSLQDRTYAQDVSRTVVANFSSPMYSLEDWHAVNSIFRFMVLARTKKATLDLSESQQLVIARRLCERFTGDDKEMVVMVFDLVAKTYAERALVQNEYSLHTIGPQLRNYHVRGIDGSELFGTVLAVSAAFSTPGRSCKVYNQHHWCTDGTVHAFDMSFYVDPESLLVVLWGKLRPEEKPALPVDVAAITPRVLGVDDWLEDDKLLSMLDDDDMLLLSDLPAAVDNSTVGDDDMLLM